MALTIMSAYGWGGFSPDVDEDDEDEDVTSIVSPHCGFLDNFVDLVDSFFV
jgi:hypothetical protein